MSGKTVTQFARNKTKEKKNICKIFDINLISIYPKDLLNVQRLKEKLIKKIF
jgi:hypothetical protein